MTVFNSETVVLQGLNLIEASAGTGKTYTLAELYLRLILEKDLTVDHILVVTYTRAATEELRDRLRQKLVDAHDDLFKLPDERTNLKAMIEPELIDKARQKLTIAIQSFDEAAIFTIHGFCQRVLGDFAFESGLRFELELVGDDQELLQSVTDDFWRREVTIADKDFIAYLLGKNESPESLLQSIRSLIGKPYLELIAVPEADINQCSHQVQKQFECVKTLWQQEQQLIVDTLQNKNLLSGNKYRATSVEKWLIHLAELMMHVDMPNSLFEGFERFTPAKLEDALKKDQLLPELKFWSACELLLEQYQYLQQARELQRQQLRLKLLEYIRKILPQRKQQQQVQSYDDLLLNLGQALDGSRGDWLVAQLRKQYQAALIDEFQDTDPIQYASFSRIYSNSGLPTFLVGDPKQAVYSFRGADIFTYLKAKSQADVEHTLTTNWRSHPDLVTAVNTIFNRHCDPFIYQDIPFNSVDSARDDEPILKLEQATPVPFNILWSGSDKPVAKKELTSIAANVTADKIARLLNLAQSDQTILIDDKTKQARALSGGDIAVLVRNHRQAHAIQQCLQKRGINSVQQGRENVFDSNEALILERVLLAIAEPSNDARVKAALVTDLWGLNAAELYLLLEDETQWLAQLDFFVELHQIWLKHGFMHLFRHLMVSISAQRRLLSQLNGDRQLTSLNHLAELIQLQCGHQNEGIEAVLHWLAIHRQSIDANDDTAQLRLESDEQLVKIVTIHKSKGLEYPIVFCPFLWDANLRSAKDKVIKYHQADHDNNACVAFSEPALTQAAGLVTVEEQAEDLRLLYVALTRARERCVIIWGAVKGVDGSALFKLLHPELSDIQSPEMATDLQALIQASKGTISVESINIEQPVHYLAETDTSQILAARRFDGIIQSPWRIGSFSALTRDHDAELPDYDAQTSKNEAIVRTTTMDRFGFPRGAQAGTCLHALFEDWDFVSQDIEAMEKLVSRTLLQYGFNDKWADIACQWLTEVLATPLSQAGLSLGQLTQAQRLDELEFYFPVADLSVNKLQQTVLPLLPPESALATVIKRLRFFDLTGFMKGFIDLVFEYKGRFYVVDYKSNHLGCAEDDYRSEQLNEAMIDHDYPLQYLIYSLALHRYLRLRLPDYDPEKHLGGVYYLFIRGMKPEWGQAGIFYDKPSVDLLDKLDLCLQGVSDE